jgi:riboflavin transporter FmnP
MAPILAPILGVYLFGGISPSNIGYVAPFLATIQRLSKTRAFLLEKRSEDCFVWAAPSLSLARTYLIIALNMWYVSWESNPAHVISREKK